MARMFCVVMLLGLQIGVSMESPPRIAACRLKFKAKPMDTASSSQTEIFTFGEGGKSIHLDIYPFGI